MLSAVLPVKAQRKSYVQLKAAYEGGFINYTCESAGMEVVYGYRTDGMVSAGVGTGLFWSSQSYDKIGMDYSSSVDIVPPPYSNFSPSFVQNLYIPVFGFLKCRLTHTRVVPYIGGDVGYAFLIPCESYSKQTKLGFYGKPFIGLDIRCGKGTLSPETGFKFQHRTDAGNSMNYNQLVIAIGYAF